MSIRHVSAGQVIDHPNERCTVLVSGAVAALCAMNQAEMDYHLRLSQYGVQNIDMQRIVQLLRSQIKDISTYKIRKKFPQNSTFGYLEDAFYSSDLLVATQDSILMEVAAVELEAILKLPLDRIATI